MFELVADKHEKDYRNKNVSFRLTEDEYFELTKLAAGERLNKADFMRALIAAHRFKKQRQKGKYCRT